MGAPVLTAPTSVHARLSSGRPVLPPGLAPGRVVHSDGSLCVLLVHGRREIQAAAPLWREYLHRHGEALSFAGPDRFLAETEENLSDLLVYLVVSNGKVVGSAPMRRIRGSVPLRIGEIGFAAVPLPRLKTAERALRLPPDVRVHNTLLAGIVASEPAVRVLCFEGVPAGSILSGYLRSSQRRFASFDPEPPRDRLFLRFSGSYRDWLARASSRVRRHDRMNRLRARGEIRLERVTEPAEVREFVRAAAAISRRTYQYRLLGVGIREPSSTERNLRSLASRGMLRSYLLRCGGEPCSFYIGYRDARTDVFVDTGFDPDFRRESAGTVLFLRLIEDLFAEDTPERLDLGAYSDYKAGLANESFPQERIWLFRRGDRSLAALGLLRAAQAASRVATGALDRLGLKDRLKSALRRRSTRHV